VYAACIDHNPQNYSYAQPLCGDSKPAVFGELSSLLGGDTCSLEIITVTDSYFSAYIQEEESLDSEVSHAKEFYGYVSILDGLLQNTDGDVIGQVGRVSVTQPNNSTWFSLSYDETISNPVVIMKANAIPDSLDTAPGGVKPFRPGHMRVKDVTETGFSYQFEEWDYLSAYTSTERPETEAVFMVVQKGAHDLSDGDTTIKMTAQTVEHTSSSTDVNSYTTVMYSEAQPADPVVLAQTQTESAGDSESEASVVVRMTNLDTDSVDVNMSNEELNGGRIGHNVEETIGVVTYWDSNTKQLSC